MKNTLILPCGDKIEYNPKDIDYNNMRNLGFRILNDMIREYAYADRNRRSENIAISMQAELDCMVLEKQFKECMWLDVCEVSAEYCLGKAKKYFKIKELRKQCKG